MSGWADDAAIAEAGDVMAAAEALILCTDRLKSDLAALLRSPRLDCQMRAAVLEEVDGKVRRQQKLVRSPLQKAAR